ncbi:DNA polymerase III subunit delta [Rubricoccus marinus]|uniref:DNA polymerase III subunit delta n=1 Tax=Rubricoccus marinus TaxID=716817 RepID=A0A259U355_9BACT|nr:DNA polymerase III subunit delta [Rubricoccus marinus]OZC04392.1 DNA polymerase III subunit delta [Rubricoccus marinus]
MAKGKNTGPSFEDLRTAFQSGNVKPLYFLYGEEGYLIDELQRLAVGLVAPHERDFNLDVIFGPEAQAQSVLAQCAQFPMMAERRVVIVRGFEQLDDNKLFSAYAAQPNPTAVVILCCNSKPNLSHHPYRALKQHAVASEFATLKDRQLHGWVESRFREQGKATESGAAQMLADLSGPDLRTVAGEVDKLVTYVGSRDRVTRDDIVQAAGHSREENVFELQSAIAGGDRARALGIGLSLMGLATNRRGEAIRMIALLGAYIQKVWKVTACREQGVPENQMARQVGVPPFVLREYIAAERRLGPRLPAAFGALLAADAELKGGSQRDPQAVFALLIRRLTPG